MLLASFTARVSGVHPPCSAYQFQSFSWLNSILSYSCSALCLFISRWKFGFFADRSSKKSVSVLKEINYSVKKYHEITWSDITLGVGWVLQERSGTPSQAVLSLCVSLSFSPLVPIGDCEIPEGRDPVSHRLAPAPARGLRQWVFCGTH